MNASAQGQTDALLVGAAPAESPLADRSTSATGELGVEQESVIDHGAPDTVLDIAPPESNADSEVPAFKPLSSMDESTRTDGEDVTSALENADVSHGPALVQETLPSLAEVDPAVQGEADEGIEDVSGDDWVVIDVNVQMESVRIS